MLPDLSKLAVTGVSNAGEFEKKGRIGRVLTHVAGGEARGAMPCWFALTAPDASPETALKKVSFALPSQVFYGEYVGENPREDGDVEMGGGQDGQPEKPTLDVQTHQVLLANNSSLGVNLSRKITFDKMPTIEHVGDMDTAKPDEFKVEFQVWTKVILAQSEIGQKLAECQLDMRNIFTDDNGQKHPYWDQDVYKATPFRVGDSWTAAREKLKELDDLKPVLEKEETEGFVGGFSYAFSHGNELKNWLPCLQSDVILYYVECLSDRTYPPMVGGYMLPEDPAMIKSRDGLFEDAFPEINKISEHGVKGGSTKPIVHDYNRNLRTVRGVLSKGYVDGLMSCPAKNFMFKRAIEHEKNRVGSAAYAQAERDFEGMQGGSGDGDDGPSGKRQRGD